MKVLFKTNIDAYNEKRCFSENFDAVPRVGDKVQVLVQFVSYFQERKLPTRLEVVDVTWKEISNNWDGVNPEACAIVELWYDLKISKLAGANTL